LEVRKITPNNLKGGVLLCAIVVFEKSLPVPKKQKACERENNNVGGSKGGLKQGTRNLRGGCGSIF